MEEGTCTRMTDLQVETVARQGSAPGSRWQRKAWREKRVLQDFAFLCVMARSLARSYVCFFHAFCFGALVCTTDAGAHQPLHDGLHQHQVLLLCSHGPGEESLRCVTYPPCQDTYFIMVTFGGWKWKVQSSVGFVANKQKKHGARLRQVGRNLVGMAWRQTDELGHFSTLFMMSKDCSGSAVFISAFLVSV